MAEKTNINIEWKAVSGAVMQEQFSIMVAAGEYEDMISASPNSYVGGIDRAIEDEVYIDASPYLRLMPNYQSMRESDPDVMKQTTTDSGNVYVSSILDSDNYVWNGPMMRTDWATELGISKVETLDDLHDYLSGVKNVLGFGEGLVFDIKEEKNYYGLVSGFQTSFGLLQKDGQVFFAPVTNEYREMLATLAQWYSEGLIWKDFPSGKDMNTPISLYGKDALAYMTCSYYGYANILPMVTGKGGNFRPTSYPVKEPGTMNHIRMLTSRVNPYAIFVTPDAVKRGNDELAFRWVDARFSEECYPVINLGEQGVDWEYRDDGSLMITELFLQKEAEQQKIGFELADRLVACRDFALRDYESQKARKTEGLMEEMKIWEATSDAAWVMPPVSLTAQESSEYSSRYADIETYTDEFTLNVIVGNTTLNDSTWNEFLGKLNTLGLDKCLEYQQAALERYNAR